MKMKLTPDMLAQIKREPDPRILADWVIDGKILEKPLGDVRDLAAKLIEKEKSIVASDGTVISIAVQAGSYKITNPAGLWQSIKDVLPEERRALCAKWSMTMLRDQIALEMNIPKTGQAPMTAEKVFDAKIRLHCEQGTRKIFQFQ